MKIKIKKPNFFTGHIYFVDEIDFLKKINFIKEFDKVEYDYKWDISRGVFIQNLENERLKFDIVPSTDFYESFFTGFLYPDNTILGKIKYIQDTNEPDAVVKGEYKKINKNLVLIRGIWESGRGVKEYFWIELIHK